MYFRVIWTPLFCCIVILSHCQTIESGKIRSRRYANKRDTLNTLPESFSFLTLQNASMVTCEEGLLQGARAVELSDSQMIDMLERKGGNYIREYMAATQEEALENFPNMLMLSAPIKIRKGNDTMTVYDNYISKYTIMQDLEKLMFYFMTTTGKDGKPMNMTGDDGKPLMGMVTASASHDNMRSTSNATPMPARTVDTTTPGKSTASPATRYPIPPSPTRTSIKSHVTNATIEKPNVPDQTSSPTGKHFTAITSKIPTHTTKDVFNVNSSKSSSTLIPSTEALTTSKLPAVTNHKSASPTTATKRTSLPITSHASTSPSTSSAASSSGFTTKDPNVIASLTALYQYLHGGGASKNFTNMSAAELDDVWEAADTTIHPLALIGLTVGHRRRKRNADGSSGHQQYCKLRGSETDDGKYVHMCSICSETTKLPDDFFPRYINEAVCQASDNDCLTIDGTVHGRCLQRPFTLNLLRKSKGRCAMVWHGGEKLVMDDWQLQPRTIRVFCECVVNKNSVFRRYVSFVGR